MRVTRLRAYSHATRDKKIREGFHEVYSLACAWCGADKSFLVVRGIKPRYATLLCHGTPCAGCSVRNSPNRNIAQRLPGVTDAKGNTVTYTLDGMGYRTGEQVKDPSGNLQRNITRVYDALNRVQQVTGASN